MAKSILGAISAGNYLTLVLCEAIEALCLCVYIFLMQQLLNQFGETDYNITRFLTRKNP